MDNVTIRVTRNNRFFLRNASIEVQLVTLPNITAQPTVGSPCPELFLERFLTHTANIFPASTEAQQLINVRGRPAESFSQQPAYLSLAGLRHEELLLASGTVPALDEGEEDEPFSFSLLTSFSKFTDQEHIVHDVSPHQSGKISQLVPSLAVSELPRLFPLAITTLRLGFEFYRTKFRGSMFSFAAGIEQRLFLEISPSTVSLFIRDDDIADSPNAILTDKPSLLTALDEALAHAEIFHGFSNQVTRLLALRQKQAVYQSVDQ